MQQIAAEAALVLALLSLGRPWSGALRAEEDAMTTKNDSFVRVSKTKRIVLKKETLRDLDVKASAARDVRGNVSSLRRLGNNYGC